MQVDILLIQETPLRSAFPFGAVTDGSLDFWERAGNYIPDIYLSDRKTYGNNDLWNEIDAQNIPVPSVFFAKKGGKQQQTIFRLSGADITRQNVANYLAILENVAEINGRYYYDAELIELNSKGQPVFPGGISPIGRNYTGGFPVWILGVLALILISKKK